MQALKFLTSFISVSDQWLADQIICAALLFLSSSGAFAIGKVLEFKGRWGFLAWLVVATVIYLILAAIAKGIIWLYYHPLVVILGIGVSILIGICVAVMKHHRRGRKQYD